AIVGWRVTSSYVVVALFFFFQAEDGIRDWSVTGVQTCALPISAGVSLAAGSLTARRAFTTVDVVHVFTIAMLIGTIMIVDLRLRSEERRVGGKERERGGACV